MDEGVANYIIWWTYLFPLDREYRNKYNIPFGSKKHNNISQIDIIFDLMEHTVLADLMDEFKQEEIKKEKVRRGEWLQENTVEVSQEEEKDFFDMPLSDIS